MTDGEDKVVPAPTQRPNLVKEVHDFTGDWGEKDRAPATYRWAIMCNAVQRSDRMISCPRKGPQFTRGSANSGTLDEPMLNFGCGRFSYKAAFQRYRREWRSARSATGPRPACSQDDGDAKSADHGPGVSLSLDFAGPLVTTRSKKRFLLIGIEHFSKWCEVWALPSMLSTKVAEAFLGVMTRYEACAELLTDNGQEFAGESDVLCQQLLITHRTTSRYHPQSNGLTERLVKTIKGGITRFGTENDRRTWDEWLPYPVMGYRMSNQAALGGYSPYFLMHGRQPMLTGQAACQLLGEPIDFDSPEQWGKRAKVLKTEMPLALGNLLAAQQRDQRWYEHVRKTGNRPRRVY
jgi:transposase InsO family protein